MEVTSWRDGAGSQVWAGPTGLDAQVSALRRALARADRDRSGALDRGELRALASRYVHALPPHMTEQALRSAPHNPDNTVLYDAFAEQLLNAHVHSDSGEVGMQGLRQQQHAGATAARDEPAVQMGAAHGRRKGQAGYVSAGISDVEAARAELAHRNGNAPSGRRPPVDGRFWDVLRHVVRDHVDVAVSKWQREELPKVISRALSQAMDRVLDDPTLLNARQ